MRAMRTISDRPKTPCEPADARQTDLTFVKSEALRDSGDATRRRRPTRSREARRAPRSVSISKLASWHSRQGSLRAKSCQHKRAAAAPPSGTGHKSDAHPNGEQPDNRDDEQPDSGDAGDSQSGAVDETDDVIESGPPNGVVQWSRRVARHSPPAICSSTAAHRNTSMLSWRRALRETKGPPSSSNRVTAPRPRSSAAAPFNASSRSVRDSGARPIGALTLGFRFLALPLPGSAIPRCISAKVESGATCDIAARILLPNPATTLSSPFIMASNPVFATS